MRLAAAVLDGRLARLEPYVDAIRDELQTALDVDPQGWAMMSRPAHAEHFDEWWRAAQDAAALGQGISYAVRRLVDGVIVGTTSFIAIDVNAASVEIGATFLCPEARGGPVNPQIKRVMLAAAFDAGARRVQIVTDARNLRSQAAIARLGARREGVLRRHKQTWTGHVRDTVVFSIVDLEWPRVRDALDARLAAYDAASSEGCG